VRFFIITKILKYLGYIIISMAGRIHIEERSVVHKDDDGESRTYLVRTGFLGNLRKQRKKQKTVIVSTGLAESIEKYNRYLMPTYHGLERFYQKREIDVLMIIPSIIGVKIKSEDGKLFRNNTYERNCSMFYSFLQTVDGNDVNIAHSSGPVTYSDLDGKIDTPEKIILFNPLLNVDYSPIEFLAKGMEVYGKELFCFNGISGMLYALNPFNYLDFLLEFSGNSENNWDLLQDFSRSGMTGMRFPVESEIFLVYTGKSKNNVFSNYDCLDQIGDECRKVTQIGISKAHEEILFNPKPYVDITLDILCD
jgi:hypothetical protein